MQVIRPPSYFCRNNACRTNYAYKRTEKSLPRRTSLCCPPARDGRRVLAKRYKYNSFSAGLPKIIHISNVFYQFSFRADFFNFGPLRWHYDYCGFVHMTFWCSQKCYKLSMNFNNFTFDYHATFKNLALTNGLGHISHLA